MTHTWFLVAFVVPFFFPFFLVALPLLVAGLLPLYVFAVSFAFITRKRNFFVFPWRAASSRSKGEPESEEAKDLLRHEDVRDTSAIEGDRLFPLPREQEQGESTDEKVFATEGDAPLSVPREWKQQQEEEHAKLEHGKTICFPVYDEQSTSICVKAPVLGTDFDKEVATHLREVSHLVLHHVTAEKVLDGNVAEEGKEMESQGEIQGEGTSELELQKLSDDGGREMQQEAPAVTQRDAPLAKDSGSWMPQEVLDVGRKEQGVMLISQEGMDKGKKEQGEMLMPQEGLDVGRKEQVEMLMSQEGMDLGIKEQGEMVMSLEGLEVGRKEQGEMLISQEGMDVGRKEQGEILMSQEGLDVGRKEQGEMFPLEPFDVVASSEQQQVEWRPFPKQHDELQTEDVKRDEEHEAVRSQAPLTAVEEQNRGIHMEETIMVPSGFAYEAKGKEINEQSLLVDVKAIMKIVGCHFDPQSPLMVQIRTLYLFLGVEPAAFDADLNDLNVAADKVELLKAVVGVK